MNSLTLTNADGSILTLTKVHHAPRYPVLVLALVAAVFIVSGLYLLLRKEKSGSSAPEV